MDMAAIIPLSFYAKFLVFLWYLKEEYTGQEFSELMKI